MTVRKGTPLRTLSNRSEIGVFYVRESLVLVYGRSAVLVHLYERKYSFRFDYKKMKADHNGLLYRLP